jgi:hypothetical protein
VANIVSGKDEQDIASVNGSDTAQILPQPLPMNTKRLSVHINFPFKFGSLDVLQDIFTNKFFYLLRFYST